MRLSVLILLFFLLTFMGILGFAPIHLHERINDKALHFSTFCILSVCLYFLWNLSFKRNLILTCGILFFLTIGSEFIQGLLPVMYCYQHGIIWLGTDLSSSFFSTDHLTGTIFWPIYLVVLLVFYLPLSATMVGKEEKNRSGVVAGNEWQWTSRLWWKKGLNVAACKAMTMASITRWHQQLPLDLWNDHNHLVYW